MIKNSEFDIEELEKERKVIFEEIKMRKDSAILISIQYLLGFEVAKILITKDSVRFVNYVQKNFNRSIARIGC